MNLTKSIRKRDQHGAGFWCGMSIGRQFVDFRYQASFLGLTDALQFSLRKLLIVSIEVKNPYSERHHSLGAVLATHNMQICPPIAKLLKSKRFPRKKLKLHSSMLPCFTRKMRPESPKQKSWIELSGKEVKPQN